MFWRGIILFVGQLSAPQEIVSRPRFLETFKRLCHANGKIQKSILLPVLRQ